GYRLLWPAFEVRCDPPLRLPAGRPGGGNRPGCEGRPRHRKDEGSVGGRRFGPPGGRSPAARHNHGHLTVNQFGRKLWQSIVLAFRPAIFNLQVLALDIAYLFQSLAERAQTDRVHFTRCVAEEPDHRHRLLRACRERPRDGRAAEERDDLAPAAHSITSSAAACRVSGTSRPSAFAVLRLITSSNLVGCVTGKLLGCSPLRIRPT